MVDAHPFYDGLGERGILAGFVAWSVDANRFRVRNGLASSIGLVGIIRVIRVGEVWPANV